MDIGEMRRLRLRALIDSRFGGNEAAFGRAVGRKQPNVNRWLTTTSKDRRTMSEKVARDIEAKLKLPTRYFDEDMDALSAIAYEASVDNLQTALSTLSRLLQPLDEDGRRSVAALLSEWAINPARKLSSVRALEVLLGPRATDHHVGKTIKPAPEGARVKKK